MNKYSVLIEWSEEDQLFLVTIPEFSERIMMPCTHGKTRQEAIKNGEEVIEMYLELWTKKEESMPLQKNRNNNIFADSLTWQQQKPYIVVDPDYQREWVLPYPLQYYVVKNNTINTWFICDRDMDFAVPTTESKTRTKTIRSFYKWCNRSIPSWVKFKKLAGVKINDQ